MEESFRHYYFVIVKFIGILGLVFWGMTQLQRNAASLVQIFLEGAVFLFCAVMYELDRSKHRKIWLLGEGILAVIAIFLLLIMGIYFVAITYFDLLGDKNSRLYPAVYLLLLISYYFHQNTSMCFLILTFLMLLYFQHHKIISRYQQMIGENLQTESRLKLDMEHSRILHKDELKQSRLQHENNLLEEKARISQALHDKLGHSINGSLYKLEAAKVLMDKQPEESSQILQEVIDNLRGCMDEIRVILRNERPDKKRMTMKSLQALCDECEEQYHIKATLTVEQDEREIPNQILEIILDNTFEAVTNSLKYSGCTEISIHIILLGEVVRCTIHDNGKGAENIEEGMGIQGMKQRVRNVKGYLDIESHQGFTINMILPLK